MGTSLELSSRVLHFVEDSHKMRYTMSLDPAIVSLLSESLAAEIILAQRSKHFIIHPLFDMLCSSFENVFLSLCKSFSGLIFAHSDCVFEVDTWSDKLYITAHGKYILSVDVVKREISQPMWFCEVS